MPVHTDTQSPLCALACMGVQVKTDKVRGMYLEGGYAKGYSQKSVLCCLIT